MTSPALDLGHGISARFVGWHPERDLNPQYDGVPDVERFGLIISHRHDDGTLCEGSIHFDGDVQRRVSPNSNKWTVHNLDPLHLEPSILRRECGLHGFIREGRWVPA